MNARDFGAPRPAAARVLAVGAWLKNAACLFEPRWPGGPNRTVWSDQHGDLGTPDARLALERSIESLLASTPLPVQAVAHDLHPDFHSTHVALEVAGRLGVPAVAVQHHHAHIGVALAEADHPADDAVIGLALDGVGHGTDGTAWGGELLWVRGAQCRRLGHLAPLALAGGDVAAREPWRVAAAVLHAAGRGDEIESRFGPSVGLSAARAVRQMLQRDLNTPRTTSAGRWFDAAAGALGLCLRQRHEAEAAIALERAAASAASAASGASALASLPPEAPARVVTTRRDGPQGATVIDPAAAVLAMFDSPPADVGAHALRFHHGLADALAEAAIAAAREHAVGVVALGGGCFFNRLLADRTAERLAAAGLRVLRPSPNGTGDSGLALGQAWVAAQRLAAAPANRRSFGCITVGVAACA